ncbi:phosphatase PAP2 family protein [Spiroplasma chinense]|uniref:Phosphatase PAP2 family protein n=1 Tax=Spiroplasma chinense TaxID=216932 RepID=A0A5B9Y5U6_9MOLU|nr:phosphatase PAP2 family protein [Spiroplasma chinense]QEH62330.1 phosphatase PAP2 family protein [Spiroplasma chinense]
MFSKNKVSIWYLYGPIITVFFIYLAFFIATSIYNVDLKIAEVADDALNYEIWKYWSQFYAVAGNTELIITFYILLLLTIQSLKYRGIENKKTGFFYTNKYLIQVCVIIFCAIWTGIHIFQLVKLKYGSSGFGPGFDAELLDSYKYKFVGKILVICYQIPIVYYASWFLVVKLPKADKEFHYKYMSGAIKGMSFTLLTYAYVVFIKVFGARPYYYNVIFGDLFEKIPEERQKYYIEHREFFFGNNDGNGNFTQNVEGVWPWWTVNNVWMRGEGYTNKTFLDYAFPSGHVNACLCTASIYYVFYDKKLNRELDLKRYLILIWLLFSTLSMSFAVVVMRWHWLSDTSFSIVVGIIMFYATHKLIDAIINKRENKINVAKSAK